MDLITPASGLLFWMVLIFGLVFFLLAKFGFPVITGMVNKRNDYIRESLQDAQKARQELAGVKQSCEEMIAQTRVEQSEMLNKARESAAAMMDRAKEDAAKQAAELVARAKEEIEQDKKDAMESMKNEVVNVSISVAEKILKQKLGDPDEQNALIGRMIDDIQKERRAGRN